MHPKLAELIGHRHLWGSCQEGFIPVGVLGKQKAISTFQLAQLIQA